jgi:PAS domain S-box-containing protein
MSESVPILKARIDELARANAVFRRQSDEIRHLDGLRRIGEQMLDCTREAIIATDLEGRITFWNSHAEKLYGWKSEEVVGHNVVSVVPAAAAVADAESIMARLRQGEPWSGEFQVRTRDGREFDVSVINTPLRAENGRVVGFIGVSSNVTELKRLQRLRKQAEDALNESERRFRAVFENAGIGIALVDLGGVPVATNPALGKMLGYSEEELCGMAFPDFTHPDDVATDLELFRELQEGKREFYQMEKRYRRKDDSIVWGKLTASLVRDLEGRPQYGIGMVEDISERKAAEDRNQKLLHDLGERVKELHALTARLNAVREEEALRIARELHDELGQAMTGMTMELAAVQRQLEPNDAALSMREVQERLAGVRRLLDTTIATTRKICTELRPALLDQMGLLPALEAQAEEFEARTGIFCNLMLPSDRVDLSPDAALAVFRIFQEILTNVARHSGATEVTVQLAVVGAEMRLDVVDNGRGVTQAEIARASGLGLIGMRERALAAGGKVLVEAEPGRGTRVILSIPWTSTGGE